MGVDAADVRGCAEPLERTAGGRELQAGSFLVALHADSPCQQHPRLRRFIRGVDLLPALHRRTQDSRGRLGVTHGEEHRAARGGGSGLQRGSVIGRSDRLQLIGSFAGKVQVSGSLPER